MPGGHRCAGRRSYADVTERVAKLAAAGRDASGWRPCWSATTRPASATWPRSTRRASGAAWPRSTSGSRPTRTQADLLEAVVQLNADPAVDGYLIQHPVPPGFDFNQAVSAMDPAKDADGLHPTNLGLLALGDRDRPPALHARSGIQAMLAPLRDPRRRPAAW